MKHLILTSTAALASLLAQPGPGVRVPMPHASPQVTTVHTADFGWTEKVVVGKPYAADTLTESTQTLADGNRIIHKNSARVFRDGQGRTRREQNIEMFGAAAPAQPAALITIHDPVAKTDWILEPERRIARRASRPAAIGFHTLEDGPHPAPKGEPGVVHFEAAVPGPSAGPSHDVVFYRTEKTSSAAASQSLGQREIEGVLCTGTKRVTKIPAGQIGNERDLEITTEEWYAPSLDLIVLSKTTDPRFGETVHRLTSIRPGEPGAHYFQVPAGFTVEEPRMVPATRVRVRDE